MTTSTATFLSTGQPLLPGLPADAPPAQRDAAWQTLRADDELWVADDPLRAPDA